MEGAPLDTYDYVIIGAGTAGSVLASRLSEDPGRTVLLLEAGPPTGPDPELMADPASAPKLYGTAVDWNFTTQPQEFADGLAHTWVRGKVLGGSSSVNAMGHLRGHRSNYDGWAAGGATGWGYDDLLPYFKRSETTHGKDPRFRGTDGPMLVHSVPAAPASESPLVEAVIQAGYPTTDDNNGEHQEGSFWLDMNTIDGKRQSAADAYLRPHRGRPNLTVVTDALVQSVNVSGKHAESVEYRLGDDIHTVSAGIEIILAAGAVGTPHLLLLSGIGPKDELEQFGIDAVVDLPGVGENLHDHVQSFIVYEASKPVHTGPYGFSLASALVRTGTSRAAPNVQIMLLDSALKMENWPADRLGYTISFALVDPWSRGTIRLASADPAVPPLINPRFLSDERDVAELRAAVDVVRAVGGTPAFEPWRVREAYPGEDADEVALVSHLRRTAKSYYHPVGTAKMGTDDASVVDPRLRVHGLTGLRVADASVMPTVATANTNATVLAIAEKAADMIISDAPRDQEH
jgi:choline dehydrogenase